MIFDTDVFIFAQRGNSKAARVINDAPRRCISVQTYLELMQGARDKKDMLFIKEMLSVMQFAVLPLTENIGHRAMVYVDQYGLHAGLRAGDAIIAATASEYNLPLVSANAKHYRLINDIDFRRFELK